MFNCNACEAGYELGNEVAPFKTWCYNEDVEENCETFDSFTSKSCTKCVDGDFALVSYNNTSTRCRAKTIRNCENDEALIERDQPEDVLQPFQVCRSGACHADFEKKYNTE